jgi:hypothetical protein
MAGPLDRIGCFALIMTSAAYHSEEIRKANIFNGVAPTRIRWGKAIRQINIDIISFLSIGCYPSG